MTCQDNDFLRAEIVMDRNCYGPKCPVTSEHVCALVSLPILYLHQTSSELTRSLIHMFETVPISKELRTTTEMWLLKDFKIQIS